MRKVIILGATGSIGNTALRAIKEKSLPLKVVGLVAFSSKDKLEALGQEFKAPTLLMENQGKEVLFAFIKSLDAEIALNGIAGAFGLYATLCCLDCHLDVALANKESIVMGGDFLLSYAKKLNQRLIPVDSEHSALYHLITDYNSVDKLIITASGGPFLNRLDLTEVTVEEAINHPTWKMGKKISIDSATLANKGLEVIEAGFLFNFKASNIEVVVHRQSVVHSMILKKDGSIYAQLSPPDMTLPIISALSDNHFELSNIVKRLDFTNLDLTFTHYDPLQFPLLSLAFKVLEQKKGYPIAFNAADEVAVKAFIDGKLKFTQIAKVVEETVNHSFETTATSYEEIITIDSKARLIANELISYA